MIGGGRREERNSISSFFSATFEKEKRPIRPKTNTKGIGVQIPPRIFLYLSSLYSPKREYRFRNFLLAFTRRIGRSFYRSAE